MDSNTTEQMNTKATIISLIIPVRNKAPFLRRCLDSVASQPLNGVEVIVVDDGSTDGGTEICGEYANKFGFETIYTKNAGVSVARNIGLDYAKGRYVTFLDADDLLVPRAIPMMLAGALTRQNVVQFGQYRCKSHANFDSRLQLPFCLTEGWYGLNALPRYYQIVWNKIYKREWLLNQNIWFTPGMQFGEDTIFNMRAILANNGLYHMGMATVTHTLDDHNSLCRGELSLERIEKLDRMMVKISESQTDTTKADWANKVINQHRDTRLYRKFGYRRGNIGKYDVVYFVKDANENEELRYSLRTIEANWPYHTVVFYGGCPDGLNPDRLVRVNQEGLNKWENVRDMIARACKDDELTENIWLFNDDFFVLKPHADDMSPQYNGELMEYVERIEKKQGTADEYTLRLRLAADELAELGYPTLNYEVHKPMLINRKKALEILEMFPNVPAFRSLYGNYWHIGGENRHDMKLKVLGGSKTDAVRWSWDFVSTSDKSFDEGEIGRYIREKFEAISRFEKGKNECVSIS